MCFLKDFKENPPRLALILRLTAIGGIDMLRYIFIYWKSLENPVLLIYYVISLYNSIMKSTYMCFLKDFKVNPPRLALILRLTAIGGIDMIYNSKNEYKAGHFDR